MALQDIIDLIRGKKIIKIITSPKYKQREIIKKIQNKVKNGNKIKVAFLVVFDSVFPAENIFKKMLDDNIFSPYIVVIPDISRGEYNQWYQLNKTYFTLSKKYKNVYSSYDKEKQCFKDFSDDIDIAFFANPYDRMTHFFYSVEYLFKKCLTIHIPYAYSGQFKYTTKVFASKEYSLFWKIYIENKNTYKIVKKFQKTNLNNLEITGYPKMDNLSILKSNTAEYTQKPIIIIAPHHTIRKIKNYLNISNFLRLADFYLTLPKKYPNIDFIFRPHPLLFVQLKMPNIWGEEKVNAYIEKLKAIPNMKYQDGGEYLSSFEQSAALINDCGSFLPEYFYFNKPQCFVLENQSKINEQFTSFGKKILKHVYKAYTEEDIINFVENVVLNNQDIMKKTREEFAQKEIMINFPNATDVIMTSVKNALGLTKRRKK